MVRARKVESAQTGTYINLSQGAIASIQGASATPVIVTQPARRAVSSGRSAAFTVRAIGAPDVTYQWQKNGVNLQEGVNIAGTTSPALLVRTAGSGDTGNYRVIVSNSGGSVVSAIAELVINQPPVAVNDTIVINQDTPVIIEVLSNDYDPDQSPVALSFSSLGFPSLTDRHSFETGNKPGYPANGAIEMIDGLPGRIRYTPNAGFFGADSFQYTVSDGEASAVGTVNITVNDTSLATGLPSLTDSDIQGGIFGASRVSADGTWRITGCCNANYSDNGHFSWRNCAGDFEMVTRVQNEIFGTFGGNGRVGLMVREGTGSDARLGFVAANDELYGEGRFYAGYRSYGGGGEVAGDPFVFPNSWVRLRRLGNEVTFFTSVDGYTWSQFGQSIVFENPNLNQTLSAGLFAAGPGNGVMDYKFYNVITDFQINRSWIEDSLPADATAVTFGGDSWNWQASAPAPYSGTLAHQSSSNSGYHYHGFDGSEMFLANSGDVIFVYVYLYSDSVPSEVMLEFASGGNWEHRAYWGANLIAQGTDGTASRRYMGPLPAVGQWVRLEVLASAVGLTDNSVGHGIRYSLYNGKAAWDYTGKTEFGWKRPLVLTNYTLLSDGTVQFQVQGGFNGTVATIESSSDLISWSTLGTANIAGGFAAFQNQTSGINRRFYRARSGDLKSVNAIGLTRLSVPAGWSMYANQLNVQDNSPGAIFAFTQIPDSLVVQIINPLGTAYDSASFTEGAWTGDTFDIKPGEGGWINSPSAFEARILGEVPLNTVNAIHQGWTICGSALPRSQSLATGLSFPLMDGDTFNIYQPASSSYDSYTYTEGEWGELGEPVCPIGQAIQINGGENPFRTWVIRHPLWP
jgi:hypothetical protein